MPRPQGLATLAATSATLLPRLATFVPSENPNPSLMAARLACNLFAAESARAVFGTPAVCGPMLAFARGARRVRLCALVEEFALYGKAQWSAPLTENRRLGPLQPP